MFGPHPRHPFGDFGRRRWAEGDMPFDFPFGRGFGRRWGGGFGPGQGERFFGRGDLKIVILELLKDQPRHGYDIIRALQERARGMYRPSPGSVYPTLQMLEDLGYVTATQQEGKKVYAITDEGRRFLESQESTIDDIRTRVTAGWEAASRPEMTDLMQELQLLARALFQQAGRGVLGDPERVKQLRSIVQRARHEVEAMGQVPPSAPPSPPSSSEQTTLV